MGAFYMGMDFSTLATLPDERIDVLTGAFLIAKDEYPCLDLRREQDRIDEIAAPLGRLDGLMAEDQAALISERLFDECGFRGNTDDYYDPKNSFLNDVVERRLGIPITLSVVYVEVARRAGVLANGVGFPGHFLVRIERASGNPLVVDPFSAGRIVGKSTLESMLGKDPRVKRLARTLIASASPREVLARMLANLKAVYATRGELSRLLLVISRILELLPDSANDRRDRGLVALQLGAPRVARGDLERYVEQRPEAGDAAEMRRVLAQLSDSRVPWN